MSLSLTFETISKQREAKELMRSYMLPISRRQAQTSPSPRPGQTSRDRDPMPKSDTIESTDSMDSSRPSSPTPMGNGTEEGEEGVVKKSLWGAGGRPPAGSGRGWGRGRGRGRGK